ncbi:MAG TPA: BON domain-containing protein [Bryobacteraceae bacterium]|nr:BON domain-containing protein [Bryobacteraceae bacterium]
MFRNAMISCGAAALLTLGACSTAPKAADVTGNVRNALKQAGLKNVSVSQDREKGVVSLTGNVASDSDKAEAESIAKANAGGQVVADEIAVLPPNDQSAAKTINADLDAGIKKNLDAALVQNRLNKQVKYAVKNGVVKLTGTVDSRATRSQAEQVAASVPNVQQVVNELEVRYTRATSSR